MRKSTETSGSPNKVETIELSIWQRRYVSDVAIELNAPNGVFIMNNSESGEDLLPQIEELFAVNKT